MSLKRPRKGAFYISKEFRFNQGRHQRGAIHRDKGFVPPRTDEVYRPSDQFFAGASFPEDEYRKAVGADLLYKAIDTLHRGGGSNKTAQPYSRCVLAVDLHDLTAWL